MKVNAEEDLHGMTGSEAEQFLNRKWSLGCWRGHMRVRLIHGNGEVLKVMVRKWADNMGIPWDPEPYNTGCTILHPAQRQSIQHRVHMPLAQLEQLKHKVQDLRIAEEAARKKQAQARAVPVKPRKPARYVETAEDQRRLFEEAIRKLGEG